MASFFRSSQNTFDTFSHLLDNLFVKPVYQNAQGCNASEILLDVDSMEEGYEKSNRAHRVELVAVGFFPFGRRCSNWSFNQG
jgi:hypothetical protein